MRCRGFAWDLAHALEDSAGSAVVAVLPDLPASFAAPPAEAIALPRAPDLPESDDDARDPLERGTGAEWLFPGHGTRTARVIAGRESGLLVGVAPAATIVPIRTIRTVIRVFAGDVAKAIDYARSMSVDVSR